MLEEDLEERLEMAPFGCFHFICAKRLNIPVHGMTNPGNSPSGE